jgi:hypothetical protein
MSEADRPRSVCSSHAVGAKPSGKLILANFTSCKVEHGLGRVSLAITFGGYLRDGYSSEYETIQPNQSLHKAIWNKFGTKSCKAM